MNTLVIVSVHKNYMLYEFLTSHLSEKYNLIISYYNDLIEMKNNRLEDINIIFTNKVYNIYSDDSIVLLLDCVFHDKIKFINSSTKILCDENNIIKLNEISKYNPYVYTYGFSEKNDITFSSIQETNAGICLLRTINSINKTPIEPLEVILDNISALSKREILGSTLILLIFEILN